MFQHQAVARKKVRALVASSAGLRWPSSHAKNASSSALRVMSGRACVVEAPQVRQRHRVRPALVVPFLTSLLAHTPQNGAFEVPDTEHGSRACSPGHHPRSMVRNAPFYTHNLAINPRNDRLWAEVTRALQG